MTDIPHKVHAYIKKDAVIRTLVVLALVLLIIGESSVLIKDFYVSRTHRPHDIAERHIEPWMTFNYINILFNLPSEYLRDSLAIDSERYPNLEIRRYAKEISIDQEALIENITLRIAEYGE